MLDNGYASSLNSAALEAVDVSRDTPEPANGKIIRNEDGEPTGLILGARQIVGGLLEQRAFTAEDWLWALRKMQKAYSAAGLTSVIDRALRPEGIRTYQRLWEKDELQVRTNMTIRLIGEEPIETLKAQTEMFAPLTGFGDNYLRIGGLKVVLDGGILIGTAYLRTPYGTNTQVYGYSVPISAASCVCRARSFSLGSSTGRSLAGRCPPIPPAARRPIYCSRPTKRWIAKSQSAAADSL